MKTLHVSTAVDPFGGLLFTDEGMVLDLNLPETLLPSYRSVLESHKVGKTTMQVTVNEEDELVGVGLLLSRHADCRKLLAAAYAQDAVALDVLARLNGAQDWFGLCSGRTFAPKWYSPEHLGFLSVPESGEGLALLLTAPDACGLPTDPQHFRLYVLENGEDASLYDSVFSPGGVTSYLAETL
ncbi:hypothetical protein [Deinococcus wulumuqiensis]|uniref:hypothetical protein n=1 Tax=Deinococcus wulumuqiensis TaxID=980427 RepID=UPI0024315FF4|nr:hypothetical protein [Deinococcus wulumuqiensis]